MGNNPEAAFEGVANPSADVAPESGDTNLNLLVFGRKHDDGIELSYLCMEGSHVRVVDDLGRKTFEDVGPCNGSCKDEIALYGMMDRNVLPLEFNVLALELVSAGVPLVGRRVQDGYAKRGGLWRQICVEGSVHFEFLAICDPGISHRYVRTRLTAQGCDGSCRKVIGLNSGEIRRLRESLEQR